MAWKPHMIARHWRGWTTLANANAYELLLREQILPGFRSIPGYQGGQVLRREADGESEFVVINYFESLDAVKRFAGEDYTVPVFEPEARELLSRIENVAHHYEIRASVAV